MASWCSRQTHSKLEKSNQVPFQFFICRCHSFIFNQEYNLEETMLHTGTTDSKRYYSVICDIRGLGGALNISSLQNFRCEFREISVGAWYGHQCGKMKAAQFCSLVIFQWRRRLNRKYRSKQNTETSTRWLFVDHNSNKLIQTTMATKTLENKGFNESHNGFALTRYKSLYISTPTYAKQSSISR